MKALSIRQPWAWMIIRPDLSGEARERWMNSDERKDIENREWPTHFRGRVLVHASKGMTHEEWEDAWEFAHGSGASPAAVEERLTFDNIERGGIVGSVEIVDCVTRSDSRWFMGTYGFVLRNPIVLPFLPVRGALGFFDVPNTGLHRTEPAAGSGTVRGLVGLSESTKGD